MNRISRNQEQPMWIVLGSIATLAVGYFSFEWLRAERQKSRIAAGRSYSHDVDADPIGQTLADHQSGEATNLIDQSIINSSGLGFKNGGGGVL